MGRSNVFQIGSTARDSERKALAFTIGGRQFFREPTDVAELRRSLWKGYVFHSTKLTEKFDYDAFLTSRPTGTRVLMMIDESNNLQVPGFGDDLESGTGDHPPVLRAEAREGPFRHRQRVRRGTQARAREAGSRGSRTQGGAQGERVSLIP